MEENILEIKDLSKKYPGRDKLALDGLSLSFSPGIYGILGENGAGKSTLFNIITGLLSKSSGSVSFRGRDIDQDLESYKSHLGYMPQQQEVYPSLTVNQFVTYLAVLKGVEKKDLTSEIERVLKASDIREIRGKKMGSLSGGMRQRVLISTALLKDPDILILDEPTAGLDPKQRIIIRNFLSSLAQDKIVLISTHVVSDIEHISKEIVIMKGGKVLIRDRPENILTRFKDIVYQGVFQAGEVEKIKKDFKVSQMQIRSDRTVFVKVYGDFEEAPTFKGRLLEKAQVDLEDVYLYLFEGGEDEIS